jgi:transmembrane sensor
MELDNTPWNNISAYLSGAMPSDEIRAFEEWVQSDPKNQEMLREARVIWERSNKRYMLLNEEMDEIAAWEEFKQRRENEKTKAFFPRFNGLRIAASISLILALTYVYTWWAGKSTELSTGDLVATIVLPDSSVVWLNQHSSLTYEKDFNTKARRVNLRGEGYFKVSGNKSKPFVITTDQGTVRVVGTEFNVRQTTNVTKVSVKEGVVAVENGNSDTVVLQHSEEAELIKEASIVKKKITDSQYAAWRRKNNPKAIEEQNNPGDFLANTTTWKKNTINMSVVEGALTNNSSVTTYSKITLKFTYTKAKNVSDVVRIVVDGPIAPGSTVNYQKRLFDILTPTELQSVEIEGAQAE